MQLAFAAPLLLSFRHGGALEIRSRTLCPARRPRPHRAAHIRCAAFARAAELPEPVKTRPAASGPFRALTAGLRDASTGASSVLALAAPERRAVLRGVFLGLLASLASLCTPLAFARLLDAVVSGGAELQPRALTLLTVYLLSASMKFFETRGIEVATHAVGASMRTRAFSALVRAPVPSLAGTGGVGGALSALSADSDVVERAAAGDTARAAAGLLEAVFALIALSLLSLPIAGLAVGMAPIALLFGARFGARAAAAARRRSQAQADAAADAAAHLGALPTVKAFAAEGTAEAGYSAGVADARRWGVVGAGAMASLEMYNRLLFSLGTVAGMAAGGALVARGMLSVGDMVSCTMYTNLLNAALGKTAASLLGAVRAAGPAKRVTWLLELSPEDAAKLSGDFVAPHRAGVELDDVSFAYPDSERLALSRASFAVPAGTSAAFVGRSGAGKSTIASLLARFHSPVRGVVRIGGDDVANMRADVLRGETVALVSQDAHMLPGSIRDNIRIGRADASDADVEAAARDAGVAAFAGQTADGLDSDAGGLSGGQRQRVNIARCLLRGAPVLIADEPCAALDAISEEFVNTSLERLMRDDRTTVLLISHKMESVRACDRIFVVDAGRIVDEGSPDELAARDGLYRELLNASAAADAGQRVQGVERD